MTYQEAVIYFSTYITFSMPLSPLITTSLSFHFLNLRVNESVEVVDVGVDAVK